MPRFFIDISAVCDDNGEKSIIITGDDAHHISRSLRMRVGEELVCCDGSGTDYACRASRITDTEVTLSVVSETPSLAEPPYRATVYQALVKEDKLDTVIMKSVELGACRIVPFTTPRCTVKLDGRDTAKKLERWNRIAAEAAKQCGRGIIPTVGEPLSFSEMIKEASCADIPLFCFERENAPLRDAITHGETVSVVVGPEGGFSDEEAKKAVAAGMKSVSLGRRILRTESAAPHVLSCVSFAFEK